MLTATAHELGQLLMQAIHDTGRNQTAIAIDLAMDDSQFSKWLRGDAHILIDRLLERADPVVVQRFGELLAERCGVCVVPERMLDGFAALVMAIARRPMLKAAQRTPGDRVRKVS